MLLLQRTKLLIENHKAKAFNLVLQPFKEL
jgi:hypothetical protein